MTAPNPRSKLLPARGRLASLQAQLSEILEGEMCYAYDKDQYYQKEEGVLVPVSVEEAPKNGSRYARRNGEWEVVSASDGPTTTDDLPEGATNKYFPEAPTDGSEYVRKNGSWEVTSGGGGGGSGDVGAGLEGRIPFYAADGTTVTASGEGLQYDDDDGKLSATEIEAEVIRSVGTGAARLTSGGDLFLEPAGDINASANQIKNMADPLDPQDAASKNYVDQEIGTIEANFPYIRWATLGDASNWRFEGPQPGLPFSLYLDPELILMRGFTYEFENISTDSASIFLIKDVPLSSGTADQYENGVEGDGTPGTVVRFTVPFTAPDTLYYQSQGYGNAYGTLSIYPKLEV